MNEKTAKVFETLSGWTEKSRFEKEHGGYVTIEEDAMTGEANAFLWRTDGDDTQVDHLQYLFFGDLTFVKK